MNITNIVAASAAGLAAILSAVNLYVSGRRELDQWSREALVETIVKFLDTSWRLRGFFEALLTESVGDTQQSLRSHARIVAAHDLETENLTRLRLLAPSNVVETAEALHEMDHRIIDAYFADSRETAFRDAVTEARDARLQFIKAARSAFRLRGVAAITHSHLGKWYEFRDLDQFT